jgi:hypothetical protein
MRDANPTVSSHTRTAEDSFRDSSRRDAMRWLAEQLRWERTLDHLRSNEDEEAARAA